jgi:hypothetical protein
MPGQKTHREVKKPQISGRLLADYMAASETARRTIVRGCKYQAIVRVIQHNEAKVAVARFIRDGMVDSGRLTEKAQALRDRIADTDFDRDLLDHNADYIDRFVKIHGVVSLPAADILAPGKTEPFEVHGVKVTPELHFRLQRTTKTNKVKVGAGMLRYAKGKALAPNVAEWQSAFIHGYLTAHPIEEAVEPEGKLCLTVDAYSGAVHAAPGDAVRRYQNMMAACASIAERWPNIAPPPGAVF